MMEEESRIEDRTSLLLLGDLLLRYRRLLIALPLVMFVLAVSYSLIKPRTYSAESRFMPQTQKLRNNAFAGFAAEFGINVDPGGATESPEFYAALIKTRDLLTEAARSQYTVEGKSAPLTVILGKRGKPLKEADVVDILQHDVATRPEPRTGMVIVHTVGSSPTLALQINHRLLELVAAFNQQKRQSSASAERAFVQARAREAQKELNNAESDLETFMERNRQYANSPQLAMQFGRLQRRVELRQDVYTSLAQAFEQARVDEVRNTPVITIVDRPDASVKREGSGLVSRSVLALLLGFIFAAALAALSEKLTHESRANPETYARVRANIPRIVPIGRIMRVIGLPPVAAGGNGQR